MKTKAQKQEEIAKGKKLLEESKVLVFTDFSGIKTEDLRRLRRELKSLGAGFLAIKKRLLNVLFKEQGIDFDTRKFKLSVGTIFSRENLEAISGPLYKFFSALPLPEGVRKDAGVEKLLGAYDLHAKRFIDPEKITFIGKLPPREVLLSQLVGMLASPIRSLLYILNQKAHQPAKAQGSQ